MKKTVTKGGTKARQESDDGSHKGHSARVELVEEYVISKNSSYSSDQDSYDQESARRGKV